MKHLKSISEYNDEIQKILLRPEKSGPEKIKFAISLINLAMKKWPTGNWHGLLNNAYYYLGDFSHSKKNGSACLVKRSSEVIDGPIINAYDRPKNNKHCFSYVVFGTNPDYFFPLLKNIIIVNHIYSGSDVLIYAIEGSSSRKAMQVYEALGAKVIWKRLELNNNAMCGVRFEALNNPNYQTVHMRDADALITPREIQILNHWILVENNYETYNIRDHLQHVDLMLAGLFGSRKYYDIDWLDELSKWPDIRGVDQNVANKFLWPRAARFGVQYDREYRNIIKSANYSEFSFGNPPIERLHIGSKIPNPNYKIIDEMRKYIGSQELDFIRSVIETTRVEM